jgi:hypothetical protein
VGPGADTNGFLSLNYSTVSNNTSSRGGGLLVIGSQLLCFNSTISGNTAQSQGGGAGIDFEGDQSGGDYGSYIAFSTITNNSMVSPLGSEIGWGGGILNRDSTVRIGKSIIAKNKDPRASTDANFSPDIGQTLPRSIAGAPWPGGTMISYDDNFIGGAAVGPGKHLNMLLDGQMTGRYVSSHLGGFVQPFDWVGKGTVTLGGLVQESGTLTPTCALQAGDPINAYTSNGGDSFFNPATDDQRHHARPAQTNLIDSGSYEK